MIVRRWSIMFMKIAALFNSTKTNTLYDTATDCIISWYEHTNNTRYTQHCHTLVQMSIPVRYYISHSYYYVMWTVEQFRLQHTTHSDNIGQQPPTPDAKRSISISDHAIYFLPLNGVWCGMTSCIMCSLTTVICNKAVAITYLKFLLTQRCLTKLLPEGVFCVPISISSLYLYVDDDGCIVI